MTIRPITLADLESVLALWTGVEGVEIAEGDSLPDLARYLERNPGTSHLATLGERVIGAVLAGHDGRRGFLYHLVVSSDARGQGVGRKLVEHAVASLKAQGIPRIVILVAQDKPRARLLEALRMGRNGLRPPHGPRHLKRPLPPSLIIT